MAIVDHDIERLAERYEKGQTLSAGEMEYLRSGSSPERWNRLQQAKGGSETGLHSIPLGKSEGEKAADYHQRAAALLGPVVDLINEARRDGMQINFQIGPPDGFNRQSLVMLEITKKLC